MDNVSMHFSKLMMPFFQKNHGIQILRLPKYSPQYNPIEIYWREIKRCIGYNVVTSIHQLKNVVEIALKKDSLIPNISEIQVE
jgi:transposase